MAACCTRMTVFGWPKSTADWSEREFILFEIKKKKFLNSEGWMVVAIFGLNLSPWREELSFV